MSSNDPRYQVGALVHAKAMHVTALIECHRRYGSNAKTKLVNGQKQMGTLITAIYSLGGQCRKVATLNSRSVKAGHVAAIPNEGNEPGTELVTRVSILIDIADETSTAHEANDVDGIPSNIDKHTESETILPAGLPVAPEETLRRRMQYRWTMILILLLRPQQLLMV